MRHLTHFLLAKHDIFNRLSQIDKIIRISARNVLNFEIQKRCFYDFLDGCTVPTFFSSRLYWVHIRIQNPCF